MSRWAHFLLFSFACIRQWISARGQITTKKGTHTSKKKTSAGECVGPRRDSQLVITPYAHCAMPSGACMMKLIKHSKTAPNCWWQTTVRATPKSKPTLAKGAPPFRQNIYKWHTAHQDSDWRLRWRFLTCAICEWHHGAKKLLCVRRRWECSRVRNQQQNSIVTVTRRCAFTADQSQWIKWAGRMDGWMETVWTRSKKLRQFIETHWEKSVSMRMPIRDFLQNSYRRKVFGL